MEFQNFQPEKEAQTSPGSQLAFWGPEETYSSPKVSCKQIGNTIVCTQDIYGGQTAQPQQAFQAIYALQQHMGLAPSNFYVQRVSDSEPPPYYPPGTLTLPGAGVQAEDPYGYHHGSKSSQTPQAGDKAAVPFDPYSFHPGDKNSPVLPLPWLTPEIPLPQPLPGNPKPEDLVKTPGTQPGQDLPGPKPTDPLRPNPGDRTQTNPCRPCRPCDPGNGRWYPGKIAGRVIGRVFGRGRCR